MQYIPIEKEALPYQLEMRLAEETFTFELHYQPEYDFFTVNLFKNGETLALGEKIVYGSPLFAAYADQRFPKVAIIPYDFSAKVHRVGWENLMNEVFLYIFSKEDLLDADFQPAD